MAFTQSVRRVVPGFLIAALLGAGAVAVGRAEQPTTLRALYGLKPPDTLLAAKTAVVLVDFQREFVSGHLPLPGASAAITRARGLTDWAHREGVLVVSVQQVATKPGALLFAVGAEPTALVPELEPAVGDLVVRKTLGGAFSRTDLDAELRARGIDTLIVCGFMTHLAVQMTANDALVLGYRVLVAGDATATRALPPARGETAVDAGLLQRAALDAMADRVADVMLVRDVVALPVKR